MENLQGKSDGGFSYTLWMNVHGDFIVGVKRRMKGGGDFHPGKAELAFVAAQQNACPPEEFPLSGLEVAERGSVVDTAGSIGIDPAHP